MIVKNKFDRYKLGLEERLKHIDNIISTLALTNCLKVNKVINYY